MTEDTWDDPTADDYPRSYQAYEAARENLREAWAALAMIRETIETLGPSGAVKASEHLDGPTFMHEADALVAGIVALAERSGGVAQASWTSNQLDKAALQLFKLDNFVSRWPSVNQEQYRREAKSILDAALSLPSTPSEPAQAPMHADIAQIIDAGWKAGKSSADVAEEIMREFEAQ